VGIPIAYLASASSSHTIQWVKSLSRRGYEIHLLTAHPPASAGEIDSDVQVHELPFRPPSGYFLNAWPVRRLLKKVKPRFLHAHYASGYGTLARLSGFHPTLLSVWGSDVYLYPHQSLLNRRNLKANLRFADYLASTSHDMLVKTEEFVHPRTPIAVTPFGVDCESFTPQDRHGDATTIGAVKSLEAVYGIDILLRGFSILVKRLPRKPLRLLIVGKGSLRGELEALARELDIHEMTEFVGAVPHAEVPDYLNRMSVCVCVSNSESFGVSVLEASACGVPVVVSDVGGLSEVVQDGVTGFVIPRASPAALADVLEKLILSPESARDMGRSGRQFVLDVYEEKKTVDVMLRLYDRILSKSAGADHA
jgi:glycosyltransferase involved in cell wall biosynthesis